MILQCNYTELRYNAENTANIQLYSGPNQSPIAREVPQHWLCVLVNRDVKIRSNFLHKQVNVEQTWSSDNTERDTGKLDFLENKQKLSVKMYIRN